MIKTSHLAKALVEILKEGRSHEEVADLAQKFLKKHNMETMLPKLLIELDCLRKKESDDFVSIRTPFALSENLAQEIAVKINNEQSQKVILIEDKKLIGGYVAEYKFREYDQSLLKHLNQLAEHFIK